MDLDLTNEQKAIREDARAMAQTVIAPKAAQVDREQRFPKEALTELAKRGLLGITVPQTLGGKGLDALACALAIEEIAAVCASTATVLSLQSFLVCEPIMRFASEAQKKAWLPGLANGSNLGCFALAESSGDIATTAEKSGDGFVLRGSKSFVTAGPHARLALVFAKSATNAPAGLSAFIVPTDEAGISFASCYDKLGLRGAVAAPMKLDAVRVPASALLGREGQGDEILRFAVEGSRIGAAAIALGIAQAAFQAATRYAISRRVAGEAIAEHQTIQFKLAEMSTRTDAARLLTWRAASARAAGESADRHAAMAKLVAAETASYVAGEAVQVLGGNGCLADFPVERNFRDAKVTEVYEGTNEILRLGIASALLKE